LLKFSVYSVCPKEKLAGFLQKPTNSIEAEENRQISGPIFYGELQSQGKIGGLHNSQAKVSVFRRIVRPIFQEIA